MNTTSEKTIVHNFFEPEHYLSQRQMALICQIQSGEVSKDNGKAVLDSLNKIAGRMNTAFNRIVKIRDIHAVSSSQFTEQEVNRINELVCKLYNREIEPELFCDEIKLCDKRIGIYKKSMSTSVRKDDSGVVLSYDKLVERKNFCFPDYTITLRMMQHEINYKEQQWPVEQRNIAYEVQMMKIKGEISNTIDRIYTDENSRKEALKLLADKRLFMYKVHTTESIPNGGATVAYIELLAVDGKLKTRVTINGQAIKVNYMDINEVGKRIRAGMKEAKNLSKGTKNK